MIEIKKLSKVFDDATSKTVALKNINLTIEDGDIYGIIGLSGAGKSTLVRCINLLEKPTSGEVLIDGEDLCKVSKDRLREIRKKVAMIFQSFNLLQQRSVLKNVELAGEINNIPPEERKEKAIKLLKTVGLGEKLDSYPSQLSGGQQQRVAIARALMTDPKVLLCDEATSALDPETTRSILELLKKLNKSLKLTIVIISHQMSVIETICNKIAIIDKSEIAEKGDIKDIFLSPKTRIAKKLIYSDSLSMLSTDKKVIKVMFDNEVNIPVITQIIQDCNILVSILYAKTKILDGKEYGQIIFRLPYYEDDIKKLSTYLTDRGILFEEVDVNDLG